MPALLSNAAYRRLLHADNSSVESLNTVFSQLGWASGLRRVPTSPGAKRVPIWELSIACEPAAVVSIGVPGREVLLTTVGYTRQARYALAWSTDRIALYDTLLWQREPGDLPLFQTDPTDHLGIADLLSLVGRDEVLKEVPSDLISADGARAALPTVLGEALSKLRLQVADASAYIGKDTANSDSEVLRLFHQLLYVRIAEDRKSPCSTARIQGLMESDAVGSELAKLLKDYQKEANSELFKPVSISIAQLPASALRAVLRQTVEPWTRLRLDFSVARADLAGKLYESYLSTLPAQEPAVKRAQRLFPVARGIDQREKQATFYTPPALARLLTKRALAPEFRRRHKVVPGKVRVVDTACGSGAFLIAAYLLIRDHLEAQRDHALRIAEREEILLECIFGADVDERALGLAQVQLLEVANLHGRLPSLRNNLFCGDSLPAPPGTKARGGEVPWDDIVTERGNFTTVLGNPPFGAQAKLPRRISVEQISALSSQYPEIRAFGQDYAYFFLALAIRLLDERGCAGLVMPRPLLSLAGGAKAREYLAKAGVSWITDFRAAHVFPHVAASIAAVVVDRTRPAQTHIEGVLDSRDDPRGVLDNLVAGVPKSITKISLPRAQLSKIAESGWTPFRARWLPQLDSHIGRQTSLLGDGPNRDIRTGVKTANVERFVLGPDDWRAANSDAIAVGKRVLPKRFLPPVVYASDIAPFDFRITGRRLFLPFESDGSPASDPQVAAELKARGGLPKNYQHGYLPTLCGPKLLLRAFAREPAVIPDHTGQYVPIMRGVQAVRMDDIQPEHLRGIAALLNSSFYQWLLRGLGAPRGDETVELTIADVHQLPFPELSISELSHLCALADRIEAAMNEHSPVLRVRAVRDERAVLDDFTLDLLEVSAKSREAIQAELIRVA